MTHTNDEKVKMQYLYLKNIMGFGGEEGMIQFDLNTNGVTVGVGSHGVGKSNLIRLLKFILGDKLQPDWVRTDNKGEGSIDVYFTDGKSIKIVIKESGKATRKFFDIEGIEMDRLDFLKNINSVGVNPGSFFNDSDYQTRIDTAVNALNLKITKEMWIKTVGDSVLPKEFRFDVSAMKQFDAAEKFFISKRQEYGRIADDYESTAESLRKQIPAPSNINFEEKLNEARESSQKIRDDWNKAESDAIANTKDEISKIDVELTELQGKMDALNRDKQALKESIETIAEKIAPEYEAKIAANDFAVKNLESELKKQETVESNKQLLKQNEENATKYRRNHKGFDELVTKIKKWKKSILEDCPIPGLEVGEKDLIVDGKPWNIVNTARKVEIFLLVVKQMFKDYPIPLVCLDNFESIGYKIRQELVIEMTKLGFQPVFTQVDPRDNVDLKLLFDFPENVTGERSGA